MRLSRAAAHDAKLDPLVAINYQRDILNAQRELNGLHTSLAGATDQLKQSIGLPLIEASAVDIQSPPAAAGIALQLVAEDIAIALAPAPGNSPTHVRYAHYRGRSECHDASPASRRHSQRDIRERHELVPAQPALDQLGHQDRRQSDRPCPSSGRSRSDRRAAGHASPERPGDSRGHRDAGSCRARPGRGAQRAPIAMRRDLPTCNASCSQQVRATVVLDKVGRQVLIREKLATLLAEVRAIVAFADLHAAFAAYASARGDTGVPNVADQSRTQAVAPDTSAESKKTSEQCTVPTFEHLAGPRSVYFTMIGAAAVLSSWHVPDGSRPGAARTQRRGHRHECP